MATISFKENLVVTNKKKIIEIAEALKSTRDSNIHPSQPPKLPPDADKLWFKR